MIEPTRPIRRPSMIKGALTNPFVAPISFMILISSRLTVIPIVIVLLIMGIITLFCLYKHMKAFSNYNPDDQDNPDNSDNPENSNEVDNSENIDEFKPYME